MKDKLIILSLGFFRSFWAKNVTRKMKRTFVYTALKAYWEYKAKMDRKKKLIQNQRSSGGVSNLVENLLFKRLEKVEDNLNEQKEEKRNQPIGFIGSISRAPSMKKKPTILRKQNTKTKAVLRSMHFQFWFISVYLGNTKSLVNLSNHSYSVRKGVMRGRFAMTSLEDRKIEHPDGKKCHI